MSILPTCTAFKQKLTASLKAIHHIIASSAEPIGGFNTGFEPVSLHGLTMGWKK
jgi:hypothetical protein